MVFAMSYYDFHIKSLGFSHYHMNKPPFSLHYLKIFPQSNMAKTLNIYHFRPFHTIAPGVGSRLCLLWRNRGARHQQRRLECPAFFCCPDMGLFENKMPPHRLLKKSQFLFKLFWDSVFIFSDGQVRCVFPFLGDVSSGEKCVTANLGFLAPPQGTSAIHRSSISNLRCNTAGRGSAEWVSTSSHQGLEQNAAVETGFLSETPKESPYCFHQFSF
jgi:hypothetical protein